MRCACPGCCKESAAPPAHASRTTGTLVPTPPLGSTTSSTSVACQLHIHDTALPVPCQSGTTTLSLWPPLPRRPASVHPAVPRPDPHLLPMPTPCHNLALHYPHENAPHLHTNFLTASEFTSCHHGLASVAHCRPTQSRSDNQTQFCTDPPLGAPLNSNRLLHPACSSTTWCVTPARLAITLQGPDPLQLPCVMIV
jgi:hypothetical protein